MNHLRIAILGGTGFVGHSLCVRLAAAGHALRILTRHRDRHRDLLVLPTAQVIEADVHNPAELKRELAGCDAAVNLVGILNESGHETFARAHAELPAKLVQACREAGVPRLLHMSALHARADAPSLYLRSKAEGERAVMAAAGDLRVTVFRPSVIFGRGDSFTNRFAALLKKVPLIFPLACPEARIQPVHVEDVTQAFALSLERHETFGKQYNLCGPGAYRLRDIVTLIARISGRRRWIIPLGPNLSRLQAALLQFVPGKPFTPDNFRSLQVPSICDEPFPAIFGTEPAKFEKIVPSYIRK